MAACKYLKGEKLDISSAAKRRVLVGKHVEYLRSCDIDRSGRGYFFPRYGTIAEAQGRQICFEHADWMMASDIVEMREIPTQPSDQA